MVQVLWLTFVIGALFTVICAVFMLSVVLFSGGVYALRGAYEWVLDRLLAGDRQDEARLRELEDEL